MGNLAFALVGLGMVILGVLTNDLAWLAWGWPIFLYFTHLNSSHEE